MNRWRCGRKGFREVIVILAAGGSLISGGCGPIGGEPEEPTLLEQLERLEEDNSWKFFNPSLVDCQPNGIFDGWDIRSPIPYRNGVSIRFETLSSEVFCPAEDDIPSCPGGPPLITADADGDGLADLLTVSVFADRLRHEYSLGVLLQDRDGSGDFNPLTPYDMDVGPDFPYLDDNHMHLVAEDFDGDSDVDLALTRATPFGPDAPSGTVTIFLNPGLGHFTTAGAGDYPNYTEPGYAGSFMGLPASIASGDLEGDGDLDLVVAHTGGLAKMLNAGDASFNEYSHWFTADTPGKPILRDFDGDGDLDLAVIDQQEYSGARRLQIAMNTAGVLGTATVVPLDMHDNLSSLAAQDLDGNGSVDLVVTSYHLTLEDEIAVLLNNGAGGFSAPVIRTVGQLKDGITIITDLDGNSYQDLLYLRDDSGTYRFVELLNTGHGAFYPGAQHTVPGSISTWLAVELFVTEVPAADIAYLGAGGVTLLKNNSRAPHSADTNRNGRPDECETFRYAQPAPREQ